MLAERRVIAIIPARAGSKGVPGKNTRPIAGHPLAWWTIRAAQESACVDYVLVTSDDDDVLVLARDLAVDCAVERAPELARDDSRMHEVVLDALTRIVPAPDPHDLLVLLQPTSPLRTGEHVDAGLRLFDGAGVRAVVGVCHAEHGLQVMGILPPDRRMGDFLQGVAQGVVQGENRQAVRAQYRINGALYAAEVAYYRETGGFIGEATIAFVMDPEDSVDIDSEFDFRVAEGELTRRLGGSA